MMTAASTPTTNQKPPRRSPGPLPPPPLGVKVLTRREAAAFMGVSIEAFSAWEGLGRVTIPRYRATKGTGRAMFYAAADLERLREEFRKLEEPHPDPEHPGIIRVPIRTHKEPLFALIDAEDLPKVQGKHWNVSRQSGSRELEVILSSIKERAAPLKRIIMGVEAPECKDQIVDFVNGNPLDCRRANLVIKSRRDVVLSRPKMTARMGRSTSSTYKGVLWDEKRRLWKAQIGSREQHRQLGRFRDEAQAAAAYDAAAREMFGASAVLNFPDGVVPAPTFLGPDGQPVREKNNYRVPRGLPVPPPGVPMLTREEAAESLGVSRGTFGHWVLAGEVSIPRYRIKAHTGAPILYAAADIARLREELDKVGQPYPDPHPARAGVWRVPLRTLGGYIEALIDAADLGIVQGKTWNFAMASGGRQDKGVVVHVGPRGSIHIQLKRLILGLQDEAPSVRINHANGNPLDCRRENLVLSSPDKSTRKGYKLLHRSGRPTTSRFKGVCWLERYGQWQAQIRVDDRPKRLGLFDEEEDAALAYDEAAREVWGAEARVNFPKPGELPSAAAPVAPAELAEGAIGPAARPPGKPREVAIVLNPEGSVTISWRSANAAASAGVVFAISRRLPAQSEFVRIGTTEGTTSQTRRPSFTDTTVPAADLFGEGKGVEYLVQGARGSSTGEASDVLRVRHGTDGAVVVRPMHAQAA